MQTYAALAVSPLPRRATLEQLPQVAAQRVSLDAPALAVMTDLRLVVAVTIDPDASIEHAMRVMVRRNVRLLFVVNVDNEIEGLITATDLLGEKPIQYLHDNGGKRREIQVREIMTPRDRLEALAYEDVRSARVGHVLATLQRSRRQHALVAERDAGGSVMVRGIFATSQLARQLGQSVQTSEVVHSFAEIEAALSGR
jgi:CBS-domain-containing membrane protein